MRVLVFGASITQGFWDTEGGWVSRLRRHYDEIETKNFDDKQPTVFNLGISGNTSKDVLNRLETETQARWPLSNELAYIFSIGTNNAIVESNGKEWSTPENYRRELEDLVAKARDFTDKIMFVGLSPCEEEKTNPVFWAKINYTNDRIKLFEDVMREFCRKEKLPHVAVFEKIQAELTSGKKLFADGLHPNNDGHQLIFELAQPELDKLLRAS